MMRLTVNTQPIKHRWESSNESIQPVLNNIAAAAHACNIYTDSWVAQCFESSRDAERFLESLGQFKGHINSYWFYALMSILDAVEEEQVYTATLLAKKLREQAELTGQIHADATEKQVHEARPAEIAQMRSDSVAGLNASNDKVQAVAASLHSNAISAKQSFAWIKDWLD